MVCILVTKGLSCVITCAGIKSLADRNTEAIDYKFTLKNNQHCFSTKGGTGS